MTRKPSPFNSNHIFVDTNVLVGGYSGDARFQKDADCLHYLYSLTGKRLYISSLSVAQLISVYQKKKLNDEIVRIVRDLQHRFNVIDFTNRDINASLTETGADIEDNVQFVLARKQKCSIIVTNNYKDYRLFFNVDYRLFFNVRVVKPDEVRTIPQ